MPSIKDLCLDAAGKALRFAPGSSRFSALAGPRKSQIVMYHRVLPNPEPFSIDPALSPDFRRHMRLLKKQFRVVSLAGMVQAWEEGRDEPGMVAVTFDDGYRDNYEHAFPILKEEGVPATIFLATDFIGTGSMPWHDRVLALFRDARAKRFAYAEAGVPDRAMGAVPERRDLAFFILGWLKRFTPEQREIRIAALRDKCEADIREREPLMLDWDQVRAMAPHGIAFGAHTMSHPIISRLTPEAIEAEAIGSKQAIERETGVPVTLFAYPNGQPGDYTEDSKAILRKCGFSCAVSTSAGVNTAATDRFSLRRRHVWDATPDGFYFRFLLERLRA